MTDKQLAIIFLQLAMQVDELADRVAGMIDDGPREKHFDFVGDKTMLFTSIIKLQTHPELFEEKEGEYLAVSEIRAFANQLADSAEILRSNAIGTVT